MRDVRGAGPLPGRRADAINGAPSPTRRSALPMQFVIITGISGSGKSLALRIFEDMGFYCVDNMPPALIPRLAELCQGSDASLSGCSGAREDGATAPEHRDSGTPEHPAAPEARVACVTDVRAGAHLAELEPALRDLSEKGVTPVVLFLD